VVSQLTWFDRVGKPFGVLGEPGYYNTVNLSQDGTHAAVSLRDASGNMDLWLVDVVRGIRMRFTFDVAEETQGIWSPDGTRIVFDSNRKGRRDLYQKAANGSGSEDVIDAIPIDKFPTAWSADGRFLLYNSSSSTPRTGNDLWVVPLFGDRKPHAYLQTTFGEGRAQFAPDGRWIAYQSDESGRNEVYVSSFPGPGGKWQVSTSGGGSPRWRRDGKELFYVAPDNKMMAARVDRRGSAFEVGAVRALFNVRMRDQSLGIPYDVTADGQRFLVNALLDKSAPSSITLVVNWPALLKK
jgi:Tol biopolymer transport system component